MEVKAIEVWKEGGYRQFITNKLEDGIHPSNKARIEWIDEVMRVKGVHVNIFGMTGKWGQRSIWKRGGTTGVGRRNIGGTVGRHYYNAKDTASRATTVGHVSI